MNGETFQVYIGETARRMGRSGIAMQYYNRDHREWYDVLSEVVGGQDIYRVKPAEAKPPESVPVGHPGSVAAEVDKLAKRVVKLDGLIGDILATIQVNLERGIIRAQKEAGTRALLDLVRVWRRRLIEA